MNELYIITGAAGHLGSALTRQLQNRDCQVRGLVLPGEKVQNHHNITYMEGDVRDADCLQRLLAHPQGQHTVVIHAAAMVSIEQEVTPRLYDVNVNGTKQVLEACRRQQVDRLVYVSSVHAIPEKEKGDVLTEISAFSPDWVEGGYAKTKAEATQAVLDAAADGLDAVVVHPSGIIGPYNGGGNHLVQMLEDYLRRRLPACVKGGYDFVDVRDVAEGCLLAAKNGKAGSCYILANRHYEVKEVLEMARRTVGGRRLPVLPMWMAKLSAPLFAKLAKLKKERPLYTRYSLYTLCSNDRFSHDKAVRELGWQPRDLKVTVRDTVNWLRSHVLLDTARKKKAKRQIASA